MNVNMEAVKRFLEKRGSKENQEIIKSIPLRFFDPFIMQGLRIDLIEPGRVLCSFTVPPRLLNTGNSLHGGATATLIDLVSSAVIYTVGARWTGVSVELSVSYLDAAFANDEIEIDAKALRIGKAIGVISVELRNKKTGKIIAQGRHTKYIAPPTSKM